MHINKLDLNLFKVLDAIYEQKSITRAAEQLNLTQPAVSHALTRLRESFSDELFVREGHTMQPTHLTRQIIDDVRESLNKLQLSIHQARHFNPQDSTQRFVVSLRDILESTCLPSLMKFIEHEAPSVEVSSVKLDRDDMEHRLASGDLDLAIDVLLPVSDDICHQVMTKDRLVVVAQKKHPAINKRLSLATYLKQKHILVSSRTHGPGREDFELSRQGLHRDIQLRCQHYFSACRVASETNLLVTMPETYAKIINRPLGNVLYPLPVEMPALDVHLYWHKNVDSDAGNIWLRKKVLASMPQESLS